MENTAWFAGGREIDFNDVAALKSNSTDIRDVLKCFFDRGAKVFLLYESPQSDGTIERFFLVRYENILIPLRGYKLSFYCVLNSALAHVITSDKVKTQALLEAWGAPVPETIYYTSLDEARSFIKRHGSIVVKPHRGSRGDGITVGVSNDIELDRALSAAKAVYSKVLLQQHVRGDDYRLVFINHEFVAAAKRAPASVTGDGTKSVQELIDAHNAIVDDYMEGMRNGSQEPSSLGHTKKIPINEVIATRGSEILGRVPGRGETVRLLDKANVSLGGLTKDVTDSVNRELIDDIAGLLRNLGLAFCGVDVLSTDIASSPGEGRTYIIEINAAPGLRMHEMPAEGEPRHLSAMVTDALVDYYRAAR